MDTINFLLALDSAGFTILRMLFSVLWQSTIVLAAAGALTWFLRRRGGDSVRHIIWTGAVCIIPLLPLLTWGAAGLGSPRAEIQVIQPYTAPMIEVEQQIPDTVSPLLPSAPSSPAVSPVPVSPLDYPWALGLVGYLLAVSAMLFWMTVGRLRIRQWILDGEAVIDPRVLNTFHETGELLGLRREYPVIENQTIPAPVTCRVFHPVVILPSGFSTELTAIELHAVALHELMHVKRRDTLVFTVVSFIRAVFFFQPLVWVACRRISYLAELACDSAVLDSQVDPAAYAELLTRIASNLPDRALSTELAAGILFSNSSFFLRIKEILSDRRDQVKKLSRLALAGLLLAGILTLAIAAALPIGEKKNSLPTKPVMPITRQEASPALASNDSIGKAASGTIGKMITYSGKVYFDGKPVSGATIYFPYRDINNIKEWAEKAAVSGPDGSFKFQRPKPKYGLSGLYATYPGHSFGWVNFFQNKDKENIAITLYEPGMIKGKVSDQKGKPVKSAEVMVKKIALTIGSSVYNTFIAGSIPGTSVKTDENGFFILRNLPAIVKCDLLVKASGYAIEVKENVIIGSENVTFSLVPEGRIEGRIMLGDTGKPAANLFLTAAGQYVTTDENGSFSVENLKAGEHIIHRLEIPPEEENFDWTMTPTKILVESGKTCHVDLKMIKGAVITGKVVNKETGLPLSNISLLIRTSKYFMAVPKKTDDQGAYKVRYPGGKATVSVSSEYDPVNDKWDPINRGTDTVTEKQVEVQEGEALSGINFSIHSQKEIKGAMVPPEVRPGFDKDSQAAGSSKNSRNSFTPQVIIPKDETSKAVTVSGNVTYERKPVGGAEIFLYHSDLEHPIKSKRMADSKSDGNFSFVIADSMYSYWNYVFVTHPKYSIGWKALKPENKNKSLNIILYNPSFISGKVIDKDMKPIKGVSIRMPTIIMADLSLEPNILTELMGFTPDIFFSTFTTISDKNGSFTFKKLPIAAKVDLSAIKPGYARYLGSGARTGFNVSIVLRPEGRISGKVIFEKTGLPAKNVEIGAQGTGNNWGNSGTTDRAGNYTITELSAGYYDVLYTIPTPLGWTAAAIESVKVEEGNETKRIDLKLIKGSIITGKVLDSETGMAVQPGKKLEVSIHGPSRPKSGAAIQGAPVRPDGSYRIRVAPGKNYIYLQTYSGKLKEKVQSHWVDVKEGETVPDINFYITKDSTPAYNYGEKTGSLKSMIDEMNEKEASEGKVVFGDEWAMIDYSKYFWISQAWGEQLRPPDGLKRAIINLTEAVNRYTNIHAKVDTHLFLDSRKIFESPFVYVASDNELKLTDTETKIFGRYLRSGGFAFIDNCASSDKLSQVEATLKQMMRDSLGSDAKFSPIPDNHPLFHCFFDFNNGPPGGYEDHITKREGDWLVNRKMKLEGIWLDNRLVVIYSNNGYAYKWNEMTNNDPQLKFGVNLVVYAITQENGIGYKKFMKSKP